MKNKITLQQSTNDYSVATVGNLSSFEGKVFIKDLLGTTSAEVSFGTLKAGESVPFYHRHKQNEEIYIFIDGEGCMMLDSNKVNVSNGSVVRVAPMVSRTVSCNGSKSLLFICIQAKANSLEQSVATDAIIEQ